MEVSISTYEDLEEAKDLRESFSRVKAEVNAKKYMHDEDYDIYEGIEFDNVVPKNLSIDQLQQLLLEKHQELIALGLVDEQPAYYVTNRSEVRVFDRSVKTCSRFGVYPGCRVNSPKGPGWAVGVFDSYMWFHLEVDYGATYWNNGVDLDAIVNKVGITVLNYSYDLDKARSLKQKQFHQPTNPDVDIEDAVSHHQRRHEMERDSDGEGEHGHQHKHHKHHQQHDSDLDLEAEETETESDKEAGKLLRGNPYPFQAPAWPQEQKIPVPYEEAPIGMITDPKIMRKIIEFSAHYVPTREGYKRIQTIGRLVQLSRVCKKFHEFCNDEILWTKGLQVEYTTLPSGEWAIKSFRPKEWLRTRHQVLKWLVVLFSRFVGTSQEGLYSHNLETSFQEIFQRQPLCDDLGVLFVELRNNFNELLNMDLQSGPDAFASALQVLKSMDEVSTSYDIDLANEFYLFTCFLKFIQQVFDTLWDKAAGTNPMAAVSIDDLQLKNNPKTSDVQKKIFYKRLTLFSLQQLRENEKLISSLCNSCGFYLQDLNDAPLEFKCDGCRNTPRFVVFIKILGMHHHASFEDPRVRCHYVYFECEKCLPLFFRTNYQPHRTTMMNEYMELMEDPELRKVLKESMAAQRGQESSPSQSETFSQSGKDSPKSQQSQFEHFDAWEGL